MKMKDLLAYAEGRLSSILYEWRDSNYLMKVLPEFAMMDEMVHNPVYHPEGMTEDSYGTALDHIIESVRVADDLLYTPEEKICVLFHDIGKCKTPSGYTLDRPFHNFYGHENVGLKVLKCMDTRLDIPDILAYKMNHCIRYHMHVHKTQIMRKAKVENLVRHPLWELLKKVSYCDDASRGTAFDAEIFNKNIEFAETLK
jgi:hypothetical protein